MCVSTFYSDNFMGKIEIFHSVLFRIEVRNLYKFVERLFKVRYLNWFSITQFMVMHRLAELPCESNKDYTTIKSHLSLDIFSILGKKFAIITILGGAKILHEDSYLEENNMPFLRSSIT